jgi:APA family basic amino acid/polyamine antiporter
MGVIFPWAYLWGPASFPGANIELAIFLTLLAQLPISLSYSFLSSLLPVSGGDYIYQSRAFGKWGFVCVMSGFVIWILQWIALSGWLFATLGLAPTFLAIGVMTNSPAVSKWGVAIQSPWGVFSVSLLLALITTVFLTRGLRLYVKVQKLLFVLTIAAIASVVCIFYLHRATFGQDLDAFVRTLVSQLGIPVDPRLADSFVTYLKADVSRSGVIVAPSFSFLSTLGVMPIVWTSLQWATYSVEQNTEIVEADRFWRQVVMLVVSAIVVAALLMLVAHYEHICAGPDFLMAASVAYWKEKVSPDSLRVVKTILQPFPNVLAIAIANSVSLSVLIALGFLANAFQVTCNSFIGMTRILVAMAGDGLLPPSLAFNRVDPTHHAPVRALWGYFFASIPVIAGYSFVLRWKSNYTLGVTFACGYVFAVTCLAAARIPSGRMRGLWMSSDIFRIRGFVIKFVGYLGFALSTAMVSAYLLVPALRNTSYTEYLAVIVGVIFLSFLLYAIARLRNSGIEEVLKNTPNEVREFYTESTHDRAD